MAKKGKPPRRFKQLHRKRWEVRGRKSTLDIWEALHEVSDSTTVNKLPDVSTILKYERLDLKPPVKYWQWLRKAGFTLEEVEDLVRAVHLDLADLCLSEVS